MSPRNPSRLLAVVLFVGGARADQLAIGSADGAPERTLVVPVERTGTNAVVGVQFELRFPSSHVAVAPPALADAPDHEVRAETVATNRQRIVVFSRHHAAMPPNLRILLVPVLGAGSPRGGPSLALENIVFSDAQGNAVPAGVSYGFMETWRRGNFTQAGRDDPLVIGDDRDPDADGVHNLVEAAVAGGTLTNDDARTGRPLFVTDGQGRLFLALRFMKTRDPAALAELETFAEASTDLVAFDAAGVTLAPTGASNAQADEFEARVETTGHPVRMLHVVVRRRTAP